MSHFLIPCSSHTSHKHFVEKTKPLPSFLLLLLLLLLLHRKTKIAHTHMAMAMASPKDPPSPAFLETIAEITTIYRSLPLRPSIEEVEAANSALQTINSEENLMLEEISLQKVPHGVPEQLFSLLQELKKTVVLFQSHEQRKEALHLLQQEKMFQTLGDLIQRASRFVSGDVPEPEPPNLAEPVGIIEADDGLVVKGKEDGEKLEKINLNVERRSSSKISFSADDGNFEKLSLMKVATVIENCASSGAEILELRGKLVEQMEWLPVSIGKLSHVCKMDLSENRIMALPSTFGDLKALTKLDLHANQLINLPHSFGELINLTDVDLRGNRLRSLPVSFEKLENLIDLDLSSNEFAQLPDLIGNLRSLRRLNVEMNELEELPYTIGNCSSLSELRLDFNQLKALPEAIGYLELLEIITLHYNRVKRLPTTMGNLGRLKELDASFNELELVPENLCFAVSLKKLNVSNNFADLRALPKSIGNLEILEELDISDDQIKALPESFRFLSKLRVFRADQTPLEVPPREVVKLGAQEVVQYMADFVAKRDAKFLVPKKKKSGFWYWFCSIFCPQRR